MQNLNWTPFHYLNLEAFLSQYSSFALIVSNLIHESVYLNVLWLNHNMSVKSEITKGSTILIYNIILIYVYKLAFEMILSEVECIRWQF